MHVRLCMCVLEPPLSAGFPPIFTSPKHPYTFTQGNQSKRLSLFDQARGLPPPPAAASKPKAGAAAGAKKKVRGFECVFVFKYVCVWMCGSCCTWFKKGRGGMVGVPMD